NLTSPQVPTGKMLDLARADPSIQKRLDNAKNHLAQLQNIVDKEKLAGILPKPQTQPTTVVQIPQQRRSFNQMRQTIAQQQELNLTELQARQRSQIANVDFFTSNTIIPLTTSEISTAFMKPIWIDDELLLARLVKINRKQYLQGCWMNWPVLNQWLTDSVQDLLPQANLKPASTDPQNSQGRRLAALPVELIPGDIPTDPIAEPSLIRYSLWIAWVCLLLAAAATAILLIGAISLSERRAAFVSAVTHELRTPLTTFRLYTDMLASDKVTDPQKQKRYLKTLSNESGRLGHLVENVLAYARLERNRQSHQRENISLQDLIDRLKDRLAERATQANMTLKVEVPDQVKTHNLYTDISSVEQILLNLVDNACKYAATADNRDIHLKASISNQTLTLQIADHGPGIPQSEAKKIFKPFRKSAHQAANSAPGVGLGLALSRRMARKMAGNLCLKSDTKEGACFELNIPIN
ncbi:MAG: sensor histidine kinase, partial [Planctomycetota bacterium]